MDVARCSLLRDASGIYSNAEQFATERCRLLFGSFDRVKSLVFGSTMNSVLLENIDGSKNRENSVNDSAITDRFPVDISLMLLFLYSIRVIDKISNSLSLIYWYNFSAQIPKNFYALKATHC